MGWQWHQLDHTHSIYTSLQADNHARTSSLDFFTDWMLFLMPNQQCQSTEGHRKGEIILEYNTHNNRLTAFCPGLPGWAGTRRNIHPPTHLIIIQSLSASSIYHDPQHPPCSNYMLGNLFAQPLSTSSLVYLLVRSAPPHILYASSPNQCLLFATHAHTIATCYAVVPRLYRSSTAILDGCLSDNMTPKQLS